MLQWKYLLDELPQMVIVVDETDKIIYCNSVTLQILGYKTDDLIGNKFSRLVVLAAGEKSNSFIEKEERNLLFGFLCKDGSSKKIICCNKILKTEDGTFNCLTQLGNLEESDRENSSTKDPYRNIVNAVPDLLFVIDETYRINFFFSPGDEVLAAPPYSFIGKKPEECLPPDVSIIVMEALNEAKLTGKSKGKVYSLGNDDDKKWFQLSVNYNESEIGHNYVALARDITQSRMNELALITSEARYRALVENSNAGIGIVDKDENFVFVNETFALMLGYSRDEMQGKSLSYFTSTNVFEQYKQKTIKRGPGFADTYETVLYHKNGDRKIFSVSASPLLSPNGDYIGTVGVLIDITEQKLSAERLRETSLRLKAVLAAMPDIIFIMDGDGNYHDYFVNDLLFPKFDHSRMVNATVQTIFDTSDQEMVMTAIKECIAKHQTKVINYQLKHGDEIVYYEARLSPMDENKVLAVVQDTTNLMELEKDLIAKHELLSILTHLAGKFINLHTSQVDDEINKTFAKIGSFASAGRVCLFDFNWITNTCSNTFEWCAEDVSPEIQNMQNIPIELFIDWVKEIKKGNVVAIPSVDSMPPDSLKEVLKQQHIKSTIAVPVMNENELLGYIGLDFVHHEKHFSESIISMLSVFAELITNLKIKQNKDNLLKQSNLVLEKQNVQLLQLNDLLKQQNDSINQKNTELALATEKAEASSRLKTAFLNNISHEIRTPLNGIVGFAQFIVDEDMPSEDKIEYVEAMNISVNRLINTISDILDVSLLVTGNMKSVKDEFNLDELVKEVYDKYENIAQQKKIEIRLFNPVTEKGNVINSDRVFITKILSELIDNAIKYTKEGHVHIGFEFLSDEIELFVEDTGMGISEEALPDIYEPFTQQDSSSTRKYDGNGCGLTVVRGLVDLLNGNIHVKSQKDIGTKFVIHLPNKQPKTQVESEFKPNVVDQSIVANLPTILLAEDENLNILYTKQIFKNKKYTLLFAKNGLEAVEIARETPGLALILMDIKMPVMDGLEATKQIRTFNSSLPIIAVTAYAGSDHHELCLSAGCNDYVSKPFEPKEFFELIDRLISK